MTETTATVISATLVKTLRDRTGAGILACRATLAETGGDLDAAIERLRELISGVDVPHVDRIPTELVVRSSTAPPRHAL